VKVRGVAALVGSLAFFGASIAQARSLLTVTCEPTSKTTCTVVIPIAGGLPNQPLTVIFPAKGYQLSQSGGSPVGKVQWELGPPANAPSDYRDGGTRYVSQISAATANGPGSKAIITFSLPTAPTPTPTQAPTTAPTLAPGSFKGSCGTDATGKANACNVSFSLAPGGKKITSLRFEPPACLINNNTSTTLPVNPDGSFNVTITFNHGTPKFTITGKIVSATKATGTISATCSGKTTTRTLTLTKTS
jgi:hypothetical protein